jgi:hypothetical protein
MMAACTVNSGNVLNRGKRNGSRVVGDGMFGSSIEISREPSAACRPKMRKRREQSLRSSVDRREPNPARSKEGRFGMTKPMNRKKSSVPDARKKDRLPERVPFAAIPTGETPDLRQWAQPVVWTDRMLTTLIENQVREGIWYALIDKVYAEENLITAARAVTEKKIPRVYHVLIAGRMTTLRKRVSTVCARLTSVSINP